MERLKVLLDTDIGGDLDDALALAYLLRQPRCDLLGVTTVGGQAERRAALASAVCHAGGRPELPVHVGASEPWLGPERQRVAEQAEALSPRWPHRDFGPHPTAVGFLAETIRAHPGEIVLLAIGPLTNLGLLFALHPELAGQLKQVVIMGGSLLARSAEEEWNILCDPYAAARVFASDAALQSVGIDVTAGCRLGAAACRDLLAAAGGPWAFVALMAEVFFRGTDTVVFHDPLAVAVPFAPELVTWQRVHLGVELCEAGRFGRTYAREDGRWPHAIACESDPTAFFRHYYALAGLSPP